MPYYPKSKIQTNLFSNGEFSRSSNGSTYIGPYYKLSDGTKYVGINPQSLRYPDELLDLTTPDSTITSEIFTKLQPPTLETLSLNTYSQNLKITPTPQKIPTPFYPQPTNQDYTTGYFSRYFAKQINASIFIEINQSTFQNLSENNSEYLWQLYNVTSIPWQISGNIENIYKTNQNLVKLAEKNGFQGLEFYLKNNYTKFYIPSETSNLYTEGNEFTTKNGQNYIGFYHIHRGTIPMVGKVHTKEAHEILIPTNKPILPKIKSQISSSFSGSDIYLTQTPSFGGGSGGGGGGY
jgi:hypothetical protein